MMRRALRVPVCATIHLDACGVVSARTLEVPWQLLTTKGLNDRAGEENAGEWTAFLAAIASPVDLSRCLLRDDGNRLLMAVSIRNATRSTNGIPQFYAAGSTPARIALRI